MEWWERSVFKEGETLVEIVAIVQIVQVGWSLEAVEGVLLGECTGGHEAKTRLSQ